MEKGLKVWVKPVLMVLALLLLLAAAFVGLLFAVSRAALAPKQELPPQPDRWEEAVAAACGLDGLRALALTDEEGAVRLQIQGEDGARFTFADFKSCTISQTVLTGGLRAEFELDCPSLGEPDAEVEISLRIREVRPDGLELPYAIGSNRYLVSRLDQPIVPDRPLAPVDFSGKALDNHLDIEEYLGIDRAAALILQAQSYMEMIQGA